MAMSPNPNSFTGKAIISAISWPPTEYPKVTVGGESFELRFTFSSSFFLETKAGISSEKLEEWTQSQHSQGKTTSMLMIMTGAMLGNAVNGKWVPMPILGEELAARVTAAEWTAIMACYVDALGKVSERWKAALATVPKTTPEPEPILN